MALQKIGKRAVWAKKSIDSIAFEYDLYVHIDGSTPISVEEKINSQFETPVSQTETWAKVSSGSIVDLDASDRAVLYSLVRNFEARTPHYRNTLRELSILAGEPQSGMNFSEDEKAMYAELRANPSLMSKFANELAYRTDWTAREFSSCGIAIWRVRRPVYVCTTPVHIMKVPAHPRLRASQMGLFPHCFLMPLTSNAYVSLALGDFDGEFVNQEIDVNVELALKQQIVAQFAYWPIVNHMICDSGRIIDHLKWAGYNCTLDSPTKKVFVRDESFRVHQQVL
ncbi:MAG: hypothetical protein MUC58_03780 [Rhizobiaceae bacterium]|jgi:hypothetical protein|nr:hypothetical protein [Rhizobiaceae bacterium]